MQDAGDRRRDEEEKEEEEEGRGQGPTADETCHIHVCQRELNSTRIALHRRVTCILVSFCAHIRLVGIREIGFSQLPNGKEMKEKKEKERKI